jgi:hypothetical protein
MVASSPRQAVCAQDPTEWAAVSWTEAPVVSGDLAEEIARLKQEPGLLFILSRWEAGCRCFRRWPGRSR